jgi:hypothetical protein
LIWVGLQNASFAIKTTRARGAKIKRSRGAKTTRKRRTKIKRSRKAKRIKFIK